VVLVV
jgi:hypothetical protein